MHSIHKKTEESQKFQTNIKQKTIRRPKYYLSFLYYTKAQVQLFYLAYKIQSPSNYTVKCSAQSTQQLEGSSRQILWYLPIPPL